MLELPESYSLAKQITKALKGKQISHIELLHTPHRFVFFKGDEREYEALLVGKTIQGATYHGGILEIDTEGSMLFLSDGASPRYWKTKEQVPKKHQLLLQFSDGSAMSCSVQMYAAIGIYSLGQCDEPYYISSSTKIGPLDEAFTYAYFKSLYKPGGKKLTTKAFLATEQRIPGLGNGVLQDILWEAALDPRCDMKTVSEEEMKALYQAVKEVLIKMCKAGGRNVEKDLYGNAGGYITKLSKLSLGKPCPRCGQPIEKANYMGGTIYFCQQCQRK